MSYYKTRETSLREWSCVNFRMKDDGLYEPCVTPITEIILEHKNGSRIVTKLCDGLSDVRITEKVTDWDTTESLEQYIQDTQIPHFFESFYDKPIIFKQQVVNVLGVDSRGCMRCVEILLHFSVDHLQGFTTHTTYDDHVEESMIYYYCDGFMFAVNHRVGSYFHHTVAFSENPVFDMLCYRLESLLRHVFDTRASKCAMMRKIDYVPPAGKQYLQAKEDFEKLQGTSR